MEIIRSMLSWRQHQLKAIYLNGSGLSPLDLEYLFLTDKLLISDFTELKCIDINNNPLLKDSIELETF